MGQIEERIVYETNTFKVIRWLTNIVGAKNMQYIKYIVSCVRHPIYKMKTLLEIKKLSDHNQVLVLYENNKYDYWQKCFNCLILSSNVKTHIIPIREFYENSLVYIKNSGRLISDGCTVICAVKNELIRIRKFYDYYRGLGITSFVMIDNCSDDGTFEYLTEQEDTLLFQSKTSYKSYKKTAWVNKVISYIGVNRWYLIVDADEFFSYPEMDRMDLNLYVNSLFEKNIFAVKTLMLEMYPKGRLFDDNKSPDDFIKDYIYYDGDEAGYFLDKSVGIVGGGLHARLFDEGKDETRTKCSLIYFNGKRFVTGSHDFYPLNEYIDTEYGGVLRHYKFLPNERNKIKKIADEGLYALGSYMYKSYERAFNQNEKLSAYYEGSRKWNGTDSILGFSFIKALTIDGKSWER